MKTPPIVSPQEWEAARQELLMEEKELTRDLDALADGPEARLLLEQILATPRDDLAGTARDRRRAPTRAWARFGPGRLALAAGAVAVSTAFCDSSRSRSARAPAFTKDAVRAASLWATFRAVSADFTAVSAEEAASRRSRASMRAITVPFVVVSPSSTLRSTTDPLSCARTVACRSAMSDPETDGPVRISSVRTATTFSRPI